MVKDLTRQLRRKLKVGANTTSGISAEQEAQRAVLVAEFDAAFYASRYPDVTGDPLDHFMAYGWREMRDPAPWFNTAAYVAKYPDIVEARLNPFYHYLQHGRAEGRVALPVESVPEAGDGLEDIVAWEVDAIRRAMDADFYAGQLREAGIDPGNADLALHYWREGAQMGLDPAPGFSTTHYLETNEDVVAARVNAFAHYVEQGKKEGRKGYFAKDDHPTPRQTAKAQAPTEAPPQIANAGSPKERERRLLAGEFDQDYYLAANPDVAAAKVDPLDHFMTSGWREGRNPNRWFSVSHYLDFYVDVAEAGINPFIHYLLAGKEEGRTPRHDLGFRYDIISSMRSLDRRIGDARAFAPKVKLIDAAQLENALKAAARLTTQGLYISVSHDDFTRNFGGVQLVLMRESAAVDAQGYDHLHIFPATPLQVTELELDDPIVGVVLNRKLIGYLPTSDLAGALYRLAPRIKSVPFVIHSLIGHRADALVHALKSAGCTSGWYWVHDYSSICTGYTLLRNDVEFCGGPPPGSTACQICVYGELRRAQISAHELLFQEFEITVLAPSDAALDVWKASSSVIAPARVHEHLKLQFSPIAARTSGATSRPLRVAYVGQPVAHKGWPAFNELTLRFGSDARYDFFHVGKNPQGIAGTFKEVAVGPDDLDEMVRTLRELEIDVAILWSLWPETFCIAAVEAMRAGAAIVTFKDSGNVAAMVRRTGFGIVLDSEEDLAALFETGRIEEVATARKPSDLRAEFSNMTADFLQEKAA